MKHLISTEDLSREDALLLLDTAESMAATQARTIKKLPVLRGRTVATLFFEDSTRTRLSLGQPAKRLSMDVISFSAKGSSVSKGESLGHGADDSGDGRRGVHRASSASGAPARLAEAGWVDVPILNAGDGKRQHLHAGSVGRLYHAPPLPHRRQRGCSRWFGPCRAPRRHHGRYSSFARGPLQCAAATHPRCQGNPRGSAHLAARWHGRVDVRCLL